MLLVFVHPDFPRTLNVGALHISFHTIPTSSFQKISSLEDVGAYGTVSCPSGTHHNYWIISASIHMICSLSLALQWELPTEIAESLLK